MVTSNHTRWAVIRRARAGRRTLAVPRVIVTGVPTSTSRAAVLEALEGAGVDAECSTAGVPWAGFVVLPEGRWPTFDAGEPCRSLRWTDVAAGEPKARRITLVVGPRAFAGMKLAAARAGLPLNGWAVKALTFAAAAGLAPSAPIEIGDESEPEGPETAGSEGAA